MPGEEGVGKYSVHKEKAIRSMQGQHSFMAQLCCVDTTLLYSVPVSPWSDEKKGLAPMSSELALPPPAVTSPIFSGCSSHCPFLWACSSVWKSLPSPLSLSASSQASLQVSPLRTRLLGIPGHAITDDPQPVFRCGKY